MNHDFLKQHWLDHVNPQSANAVRYPGIPHLLQNTHSLCAPQSRLYFCHAKCTVPLPTFCMFNRGSVWDWVPLQTGADLGEKSCFRLLKERKGLTSNMHLLSLVTVISEHASMTVGGEFWYYKSATLTLLTGALRHRKCKWCSWGCCGTPYGYGDFMYQDWS